MSLPYAYVDTSAFIKRFVIENMTEEMEAFASSESHLLVISSLTITEFRSILKRRLRTGTVSPLFVTKAIEQLSVEIASNALKLQTIDASTFQMAGDLIERLDSPIATLDALHLACAKAASCTLLVSADKQLLKAAQEAGLQILNLS